MQYTRQNITSSGAPRSRRKIFVRGVKQYAEKLIKYLDTLDPDIEVLEVSCPLDHVHGVLVIPPRVSVAEVIQFIKSQTGKLLKLKFPFLQSAMSGKEGIWSRGYCVSTVGLNEKEILAYVRYQEKEDKGQLKLDF